MKNARKLLLLLAENALLNDNCRGYASSNDFHLPNIPDDERIRIHTPKIRKHYTKRRVNKLHERRRK
jgi:hypothetical protein